MKRTVVLIPDPLYKKIKAHAKEQSISIGSYLRLSALERLKTTVSVS